MLIERIHMITLYEGLKDSPSVVDSLNIFQRWNPNGNCVWKVTSLHSYYFRWPRLSLTVQFRNILIVVFEWFFLTVEILWETKEHEYLPRLFNWTQNSGNIEHIYSCIYPYLNVRVNSSREHPPPPPRGENPGIEKIGNQLSLANAPPPFPIMTIKCSAPQSIRPIYKIVVAIFW